MKKLLLTVLAVIFISNVILVCYFGLVLPNSNLIEEWAAKLVAIFCHLAISRFVCLAFQILAFGFAFKGSLVPSGSEEVANLNLVALQSVMFGMLFLEQASPALQLASVIVSVITITTGMRNLVVMRRELKKLERSINCS